VIQAEEGLALAEVVFDPPMIMASERRGADHVALLAPGHAEAEQRRVCLLAPELRSVARWRTSW
jgi:hypothetical protein